MNLENIIETVNMVSELDIKRDTRKREYVIVRGIYYKIAKEFTTFTLQQIGSAVGRDHASVINSKKTIEQDLKARPSFYAIHETCLELLGFKEKEVKQEVEIIFKVPEEYKNINSEVIKILSTFDEQQQQELLEFKIKPFKKMQDSRVNPKQFIKVHGAKLLR